MVFFHGGNLCLGLANTDFGQLATHGTGVVLVDVNYRMSLEGFFSVEAMLSEANSTGMYGILDMIESLRWVQRNIAGFGGDPSRVTIFGQSSGGTAVMVLVASPLTAGLFSSAMSLSGSPNVSTPAAVQRQQHQHIADSLLVWCRSENPSEELSCLRSRSTSLMGRLWLAQPKLGAHAPGTDVSPSWGMFNIFDIPRYADGLRMPALAAVDGEVLPEPLPEALSLARNDVPLIISTMGQEISDGAQDVSKLSFQDFEALLNDAFSFKNDTFGSQVMETYAADVSASLQLAFDNIGADVGVTCGNLHVAQAAGSGHGRAPVYLVHNEQYTNEHRLAYHGADLNMAVSGTGALADALRDAWHEFAATGRVVAWQPVGAASPWITNSLTNNGSQAVIGHKARECDFWRSAGFGPEFSWSN